MVQAVSVSSYKQQSTFNTYAIVRLSHQHESARTASTEESWEVIDNLERMYFGLVKDTAMKSDPYERLS